MALSDSLKYLENMRQIVKKSKQGKELTRSLRVIDEAELYVTALYHALKAN